MDEVERAELDEVRMVGQGFHNATVDSTDSDLSDNDNGSEFDAADGMDNFSDSTYLLVINTSIVRTLLFASTKQCFHFLSHSSCATQVYPPTL